MRSMMTGVGIQVVLTSGERITSAKAVHIIIIWEMVLHLQQKLRRTDYVYESTSLLQEKGLLL